MGVYFYRIYKDTQLQNMVDQTVENGDMMGTLQKMSNYDSRIKDIIENQDQYPKELLELLTANIETIEFVFDYPEKKDNLPATIVEEAKSGEIPLLLQWDERWGYQNYGDGMLAVNGCGPTALSMVIVGLTGNKQAEYSCAATPQIRQTGNRLSGLAETAYASLLAQCFV